MQRVRDSFSGIWLAALVFGGIAFGGTAAAVTPVSEAYGSETKLPLASIVSLKQDTTDQILLTDATNVSNMIGVVISPDDSLLSLTNGASDQTQVATDGTVNVLVSDMNGTVSRGDHITASPIAGVGMRTVTNARVLGIAQGDLKVSDDAKQTYKDKSGAEHSVAIGTVPVQIAISYYFKEPDKTLVPTALQNVANAIAGKEVSTIPIIVSVAIFVVMILVVVSIVYSMIKSSIISVGRNPMSQSAVYRGVVQISALVLAILGVGVVAIYLVLTRM